MLSQSSGRSVQAWLRTALCLTFASHFLMNSALAALLIYPHPDAGPFLQRPNAQGHLSTASLSRTLPRQQSLEQPGGIHHGKRPFTSQTTHTPMDFILATQGTMGATQGANKAGGIAATQGAPNTVVDTAMRTAQQGESFLADGAVQGGATVTDSAVAMREQQGGEGAVSTGASMIRGEGGEYLGVSDTRVAGAGQGDVSTTDTIKHDNVIHLRKLTAGPDDSVPAAERQGATPSYYDWQNAVLKLTNEAWKRGNAKSPKPQQSNTSGNTPYTAAESERVLATPSTQTTPSPSDRVTPDPTLPPVAPTNPTAAPTASLSPGRSPSPRPHRDGSKSNAQANRRTRSTATSPVVSPSSVSSQDSRPASSPQAGAAGSTDTPPMVKMASRADARMNSGSVGDMPGGLVMQQEGDLVGGGDVGSVGSGGENRVIGQAQASVTSDSVSVTSDRAGSIEVAGSVSGRNGPSVVPGRVTVPATDVTQAGSTEGADARVVPQTGTAVGGSTAAGSTQPGPTATQGRMSPAGQSTVPAGTTTDGVDSNTDKAGGLASAGTGTATGQVIGTDRTAGPGGAEGAMGSTTPSTTVYPRQGTPPANRLTGGMVGTRINVPSSSLGDAAGAPAGVADGARPGAGVEATPGAAVDSTAPSPMVAADVDYEDNGTGGQDAAGAKAQGEGGTPAAGTGGSSGTVVAKDKKDMPAWVWAAFMIPILAVILVGLIIFYVKCRDRFCCGGSSRRSYKRHQTFKDEHVNNAFLVSSRGSSGSLGKETTGLFSAPHPHSSTFSHSSATHKRAYSASDVHSKSSARSHTKTHSVTTATAEEEYRNPMYNPLHQPLPNPQEEVVGANGAAAATADGQPVKVGPANIHVNPIHTVVLRQDNESKEELMHAVATRMFFNPLVDDPNTPKGQDAPVESMPPMTRTVTKDSETGLTPTGLTPTHVNSPFHNGLARDPSTGITPAHAPESHVVMMNNPMVQHGSESANPFDNSLVYSHEIQQVMARHQHAPTPNPNSALVRALDASKARMNNGF